MKIVSRVLNPRVLVVAVMAAICASLFAPFALADSPPAETFIQQNVQKGLTILAAKDTAPDQTAAQFRSFLNSLTDVRRIALFTLGPDATTAPPAQVDAFVAAFQDYTTAVYQSQLAHYSGQSLVVMGSEQHAPGDFIVRTRVADLGRPVPTNAEEVDFRVVAANGSYEILDASVYGVWLASNERDQFAGFLSQHNNDVAALTAHVKDVTAQMQAK